MACSPGMSQALARSPGLVVSTVLTCMVGALLPPLPGLMLFASGLALTAVLALAIAKTVGWLPLTQFAWRIRFVVAAVAAAQSVADGRIAAGMVVAVFIPLTYLAPRWQRRWDMRSQDDSDRFVADHELGDALGRFLRRCPPEPRTLERIHRLTGPDVRPSLSLVVSDPTPTGRG